MPVRLLRLLAVLCALTLVAVACSDDDAETTAVDNSAAPTDSDDVGPADGADWPHTFVGDQIGGGQIDAGDLAGRDLVLWFWAPW